MIRIIDTLKNVDSLFPYGHFDIELWKKYINGIYEGSADIFLDDIKDYFGTGKYTFEGDFLPIIENVLNNARLDTLHSSFLCATEGLSKRIKERCGKELDTDIVLYLGLCNGAGWVTHINGRDTVLLGIEKILELDWCDIDSMYGLIYHELGHIYQMQYGVLHRECESSAKSFVWQLFCEGIAMHFEQLLVGKEGYFHQDRDGWRDWCDRHFCEILSDFRSDLDTMTRENQRYFGDWADYNGRGDVGYYLGARFISFMLKSFTLDTLVNLDIDEVYGLFEEFTSAYS